MGIGAIIAPIASVAASTLIPIAIEGMVKQAAKDKAAKIAKLSKPVQQSAPIADVTPDSTESSITGKPKLKAYYKGGRINGKAIRGLTKGKIL